MKKKKVLEVLDKLDKLYEKEINDNPGIQGVMSKNFAKKDAIFDVRCLLNLFPKGMVIPTKNIN